MGQFQERVVIVTGGGSGIGRVTALAFAREGARVLLSDVNEVGGEETAAEIEGQGGIARFMAVDVRAADQVAAMVDAAVREFGGLHVAVNNAGVGGERLSNIQDDSEANYDLVMDVNVKGVWLGMKYEIPALIASGGGAIINIASVAGLIAFPGNAVYSASKHAVIGLTKSVAVEAVRHGIRVNAICPSYTDTRMVSTMVDQQPRLAERVKSASPMRRLATPEEIVANILYLASDQAAYVNGIALAVDGGLTAT